MNICQKVDDIVWGDSHLNQVWDETFMLLMQEVSSTNILIKITLKWISSKIDEFDSKYQKVSNILSELGWSDGVRKLALHYQAITERYKAAYNCCRSIEFLL